MTPSSQVHTDSACPLLPVEIRYLDLDYRGDREKKWRKTIFASYMCISGTHHRGR